MSIQTFLKLESNPNFEDFESDKQILSEELEYVKNLSPTSLPASLISTMSERKLLMDPTGRKICINMNKGTTTLAFRYKTGLIIAVDSRATGGQYIASGNVTKIIKINKHLVGTMAGGAADCIYWERVLSMRCRMHELRNRESISVGAAAKLLSNMVYGYKGMGISMGVMICGWDKKGPAIYYVDDSGHIFPGDLFSVGSGSPYAYGCLDSEYKFDLSDEDAIDLARKSIYHATYRDIASGGKVRVCLLNQDGWKMISEDDCLDLHYKYLDEKMTN